MGTITINGRKVEFTNEKNLLTIIRKAGIDIPTLCYQPELSTFSDCRLCTVEDDKGRTFASCSEPPKDGMVIFTNTERLRKHRKLIVELMLAAHDKDCTSCERSGECPLQDLAKRMEVDTVRFENYKEKLPIDASSPSIVRDPNKCILCGNCVRVCNEIQGIGALDFAFRGSDAQVTPAFNRPLNTTKCVSCGQCRVVCTTGALNVKSHTDRVWEALDNKNVRVVAQIAPAVRVAVGEAFGMAEGENVMAKIVSALHLMGFDRVFDTTFTADLTIMEESAEFLARVEKGENLPLLTSCCPAWVKFVENEFPEFEPNVSSCRSPQQMFSALLKDYYYEPEHAKGKETFVVSIMPCTAKKMESERPEAYTDGRKDTDAVITTTELVRMIKSFGLDFKNLEGEACDMPFGFGSGGGLIFGVTGGVTEAVLRRLSEGHDPESYEAIAETGVRGNEGIKEFSVDYKGTQINICVVSGLKNAREVMESVKNGEKQYHLIEVMACPGGCVMGGGQPTRLDHKPATFRGKGIYAADKRIVLKKSNDNPLLTNFYSHTSEERVKELLHVPGKH